MQKKQIRCLDKNVNVLSVQVKVKNFLVKLTVILTEKISDAFLIT